MKSSHNKRSQESWPTFLVRLGVEKAAESKKSAMDFVRTKEDLFLPLIVTLTVVLIDITSIFFLFLCGSALFCYSLNKKAKWSVTCGGLFVLFYILSWKFVGLDAMLIVTIYALKYVTAIEDDSRGFFYRLSVYCLSVFASVMTLMVFVGFVYDGVLEGTESFVAVQLFSLLYGLSKYLDNLNNFQLGLNLFLLGTILYGHLASALAIQLVVYWIIYRKFASVFEDWLFLLMQAGTVAIQVYYIQNEECIVGAYTFPMLLVGVLFCYVEKNIESSLMFFATSIKFLLAEWYIHESYTLSAIFAACYACYCYKPHQQIIPIVEELVSSLMSTCSEFFCQTRTITKNEKARQNGSAKKQSTKITTQSPPPAITPVQQNGIIHNRAKSKPVEMPAKHVEPNNNVVVEPPVKVKEVSPKVEPFKVIRRKKSFQVPCEIDAAATISPEESPLHNRDSPSPCNAREFNLPPIEILRQDRLENVGDFEVPNFHELAKIRSLEEFPFPQKYAYLLDLEELTERTLANEDIYRTITSQPIRRDPVIVKQRALLALQWAHDQMTSRKPIVEDGSLKYCTHRVLTTKPGEPAEIELEFTFNSNQLRDEHRLPACGDILSFKEYKTEMDAVRKAKVIRVGDGQLTLISWIWRTACTSGQEELYKLTHLEDERVDAYEYFSRFLYTSVDRSIERFFSSKDFDDFLVPKPNFHIVKKLFERKRDKFLPMLQSYAALNKEQAMALYSICTSSHKTYPFILHGPPGTGKTHTIVSTVRCLLEMDPRVRILLATPSNTAADLLGVRLYKELPRSLIKKEEMLRLRSPNTDFFERNRDLDPISCIDEELRSFDIPDHSRLIQYRLIISSLGCTAHIVDRRVIPGFFTHIIIDEAGQATESEVWIPIGGLTTKKTSVVLCGDPKQLGAVYKLEMKQITTEKFGTSLTRYMEQQNLQSEPRVFCQLVQSYRCHPAILEIASRLFYDSRLIPQVTGRLEPFENWKALPNKKFPVLFVNVFGKAISNKSNSYCNEDEVKVVLSYIARLIRDNLGVTPSDIGVVSPYSFQTRTMRSELEKAGIDPRLLTIDTIERYQGAERKVIIMSTVRTGSLGFVANDPRLNTSITRAKHLLIVIGHEHTLRRHPSWNTFIDYCKENGSHVQWTGRVKDF